MYGQAGTCPPTGYDGTNASRLKAMSSGYMNKEIQRLEAEIEQLLSKPSSSTPATLRWEAERGDAARRIEAA